MEEPGIRRRPVPGRPQLFGPGARRASVLLAAVLFACSPGGPETTDSAPDETREISESSVRNFLAANKKLYSQFNEELLIRHFFEDKRDGVFLDVGCAYPIRISTTYYLEKHLGWSGIAIDALERYRKAWETTRSQSTFLAYAVTDKSGETITFYVAGQPSVSSLSEEQAEKWGGPESVPVEVPTITLTDVLEEQNIDRIDFLSLDIEGAEPAALAGFDIERFKPELVCIEAHTNDGANEEEILAYFAEHGYARIEAYLPYDLANWYFTPRTDPENGQAPGP